MNKSYIPLAALVISLATIVFQAGYLTARVDRIEKRQDCVAKETVSKELYESGNMNLVNRFDRFETKIETKIESLEKVIRDIIADK